MSKLSSQTMIFSLWAKKNMGRGEMLIKIGIHSEQNKYGSMLVHRHTILTF